MTTITPKPWKRYCIRNHDTWVEGRTKVSRMCKRCLRNANRQAQRERTKRNRGKPEFIPGLKDLRISRGYTIEQIAWESGLDIRTLAKFELETEKATYRERVAIFQAFNILRNRELEREEERVIEARRRVWAGLA